MTESPSFIFTFILTSLLYLALSEPYCKKLDSVSRSPDQSRKGHLNFDIGGATPRTLRTNDSVLDGVGSSRGRKRLRSNAE